MPRSAYKLTIPAALISGAFLLGSGLTGCGKTQSSATLVAEAQAYQQKGDRKAAVIQYKNAVEKSPEDASIRLLLGQLYLDISDFVSAEKEARKAISLGAPAAKTAPMLASALLGQGQHQKVIDETAAGVASATPELLVARGNAYLQLGDADKAKAAFDAALSANPTDGNALLGLAAHAAGTKDLPAAARYVELAGQKDPKNAEVWMFKGLLASREGKNDVALAAYSQALVLKPDHRTAHIEKAYLEIGSGKFDLARADIEAARKLMPGSVIVVYTQALLDHTEGKNAQALESIQKVLRAAPEHMPSILLAGAIQLALGSYEQAEQNLKKYLEKYPNTLYARKLLAATLLRSAQPGDAAAALAPVLTETQDPQLLALAGESYMQARDFDKASDFFQRASVLAPKEASLHTSLGLSKLGQGDNAKAISELELAATMNPKSQQAGVALVRTQLSLKQYDKALATVQGLEKQQPENAMVQNLKGGVYMSRDDKPNARAAFNRALELQPTYFAAVVNLAQIDAAEKKPAEARKRFLAFLEKDKKHIGAMTSLAELSLMENKPAEATTWLEKAVSDNPDAVAPGMMLVTQYQRVKEPAKALTLARKLQTANPTNPALLDLLGQVQLANKDNDGALETFSKVTSLSPKSATAHLRLAAVHSLLKNDAAAADDVKRALALEPDNVQAQLAMVDLAMRKNDPDQALLLVRKLQKQLPNAPAGYLIEGDVLAIQKKPDLALRAYEQAYAVGKQPQLFLKVVMGMKVVGKTKEADARVAQYMKENPDDMLLNMYAGESRLNAKQYKEAVPFFETVIKKNPDNIVALNNVAWAYQQLKDPRALPTAEKAAKLAPDSANVLDTLGWLLVEQGNTQRALPMLEKAALAAPQQGDIRFHFATALAKSGNKDKAKQELDAALAGKPFDQLEAARALRATL